MAADNDNMEVEVGVEDGDGKVGDRVIDVDGPQSPIQSIQAGRSQKATKCAFCRKDHKKCVRTSDDAKCERCLNLNYGCFGGLEAAISSSPKRVFNRKKCNYCRALKQKCLPVDRVWPDICERCRERGLPCSKPESTRERPRVDSGPSTSASHLDTEAHRYSESVQSAVTNKETPRKTPQPFPLDFGTHQPLSAVDKSSLEAATIGVSDDSNLAMLSRAAVIYQKDSTVLPSLQNCSEDYAIIKRKRKKALARWQRAFRIIRKGVRINNIASIFLYAPQPDGIALCNVCVNLRLSRENFVAQPKDHHSQLKREPLHLQDRLWPASKRAETGTDFPLEGIKLGNVGTIRRRGHICSFCRLVWNSAQDQVHSSEYTKIDTIMAYATWQIDGRRILPRGSGKTFSAKPRNRRIRLHWSKGATEHSHESGLMLNDAFIVLVANGKQSWDSSFLGRSIDIDNSITTITKDWVEQCQRHHPHNNEIIPEEQFYWGEAIGHKFRLLDVVQMRTVSPEQAAPQYVALSYPWAGERNFCIRKEEAEKFDLLGLRGGVEAVWSELPSTIQDAITLVKALEFRYLWVDVLCTIFDDSRIDHRTMAQIFSNAFLTVCAADGHDPDAGLRALSKERKPPVQHIERCAPGLELMVMHPAETYINQSVWNSQAWTFQERALSNRCLIFVADRVYWECRDATASEDIIENSREPGWSIDMLYNPLKILGDLSDQPRAIRAYMRCVEAYTPRQLSKPDDVLKAFEGVGKVISKTLKTDLLYGLPSSFLDLALLWEFKKAPPKHQRRQSPDVQGFPTWSWSGWEGPITYRTSTLSGTLSNILDWISTHTWISWYVRDRYNITRLLHKSGQEPIMVPRPRVASTLDGVLSKIKKEKKWMHDKAILSLEPRDVAMQLFQQQPVKWPAQNRSMFFKSVPNLQFDTMDVDSEGSEDLEYHDTKYLQFWTWSGFFRLDDRPLSSSSNLGPGLSRFGILDSKDDFCGTIVLPDQWVETAIREKGIDIVYELIAISEAKDFTPEEFDGWTYYIPKERDESEWDLWYVLLVEKIDEVVVRRVGLGKVFQEAFENSCLPGKEWREFIMA